MEAHSKKPKRQQLVNFFPNEVLTEVLLKLPVKSLIRFRSVSRFWHCQLSNSRFVKKHLRLSTEEDSLEKWRIILRYPYHTLKSCSLYSLYHEPFGYSVDLDYPMKELRNKVHIVGSCNGLVCFYVKQTRLPHTLFVWNPSTRESRQLPFCLGCDLFSCYAFGYSEIIDDYKIVKLRTNLGKPMVFSLTTDSWKYIDNFPFELDSIYSGKLVNGALNWGLNVLPDGRWVIVSFDLAEERFGEVPQPNYGDKPIEPFVRVLEGCLSVLCHEAEICVDVWMMKQYGVKESWTKLVTVPYSSIELRTFEVPRSFCFLKHGGILMYFGRTLALFDLEEKTFKYPVIYGVQVCHEADSYVESLVSPNAYRRIGGFDLNN